MELAVLMTCHNRRSVTLRGLGSLLGELQSIPDLNAHLFLVDDGSSDGTGDEVRSRYPHVTVVMGTGHLFWNGGMCLAYAVAHAIQHYDAFLLFNDDVDLFREELSRFFDSYQTANSLKPTIMVGAMTSRNGESITYSGLRRTSKYRLLAFQRTVVDGTPHQCDTFNGNFVMVPGPFFETIGGLDPRYRHGFGDIDLGLVALTRGLDVITYASPIGICERGVSVSERIAAGSLKDRWQLLFSGPTGIRPYLYFAWKHGAHLLYPVYVAQAVLSRCWLMLGAQSHQEF